MKVKEIESSIKTVYRSLRFALMFYGMGIDDKSEDNKEYTSGKIRKFIDAAKDDASSLFLGEKKIAKKLRRIIAETERIITEGETRGAPKRWYRRNSKLAYFDPVYYEIEKDEALLDFCLKQMREKLLPMTFAFYPTRREYIKRTIFLQECKSENALTDELLHTLTSVFENELHKYLKRR